MLLIQFLERTALMLNVFRKWVTQVTRSLVKMETLRFYTVLPRLGPLGSIKRRDFP